MDAGSYQVRYKVTKQGYKDYISKPVAFTINKANVTINVADEYVYVGETEVNIDTDYSLECADNIKNIVEAIDFDIVAPSYDPTTDLAGQTYNLNITTTESLRNLDVVVNKGTLYVTDKGIVVLNGAEMTGYSNIIDALNNAQTDTKMVLSTDVQNKIEIDESFYSLTAKDISVDLNGHTLDLLGGKTIEVSNAELSFTDGNLSYNGFSKGNKAAFKALANAEIRLNDVDYATDGSALDAQGDGATIKVYDSNVAGGCFCVTTNASTPIDGEVIISLKNSSFVARGWDFDETDVENTTDYDNCPILINIPGNITIENCVITGDRQAVVIRGGNAIIKNSEINFTGKYVVDEDQYLTQTWSDGNEVVKAGVVVGDRSESYDYPASLVLENTTVVAQTEGDIAIYVRQDGKIDETNGVEYTATLTITAGTITDEIINSNATLIKDGVPVVAQETAE